VLPVLAGAKSIWLSVVTGGSLIVLVSVILSFLSGMDVRQRVVTNLIVIALAVGVSFAIGFAANRLWGVGI
jgi:hypothetical protein